MDAVSGLTEARPSMGQARWRLYDAGYERIGNETSYGEVFRRSGDPYVLKLFKTSDKAFPAFIGYATNIRSPHLPIFRSKVVTVTNDYAAIRMEYLPPLSRSSANRLSHDLESCVLAWMNGPPVWPWIKKVMSRLERTQSTLLAVVKDLTEKLMIGDGFYPDLKPEHFRQRGSTIVLIDPICGFGQGQDH